MIMENRSRRLGEPLRWGRREKAAVATVAACIALALAALGVYALTSGSHPRKDCIDVTFASTVGAATPHACGSRARRICASGTSGIGAELEGACRRAGFAFKP